MASWASVVSFIRCCTAKSCVSISGYKFTIIGVQWILFLEIIILHLFLKGGAACRCAADFVLVQL